MNLLFWKRRKKRKSRLEEMDWRHGLHGSVSEPHTDDTLNVVRCVGCRRLLTQWEIYQEGMCPSCGGAKMHGAYPAWWEWPRLYWHEYILRSYVTRGPKGRGWTVERG